MGRTCRTIVLAYVVLCVLSLALVGISNLHLFGGGSSPLTGLLAFGLAQPWMTLLSRLASGTNQVLDLALVVFGMIANAAILRAICGIIGRDRSPP